MFFICRLYLFRQQRFYSSLFFFLSCFSPFVCSYSISLFLHLFYLAFICVFSCIHYCFIFKFFFLIHIYLISSAPSLFICSYSFFSTPVPSSLYITFLSPFLPLLFLSSFITFFPLPSLFMSFLSITVYSTFPVSLSIHLSPHFYYHLLFFFSFHRHVFLSFLLFLFSVTKCPLRPFP